MLEKKKVRLIVVEDCVNVGISSIPSWHSGKFKMSSLAYKMIKSGKGIVDSFQVILHEESDTAMQVAETSRTDVQRDIILCHIKEQVKTDLQATDEEYEREELGFKFKSSRRPSDGERGNDE